MIAARTAAVFKKNPQYNCGNSCLSSGSSCWAAPLIAALTTVELMFTYVLVFYLSSRASFLRSLQGCLANFSQQFCLGKSEIGDREVRAREKQRRPSNMQGDGEVSEREKQRRPRTNTQARKRQDKL
jgi:hypothetical protein